MEVTFKYVVLCLMKKDHNNRSLIHVAASNGHLELVKLLVEYKVRLEYFVF